MELFINQGKDSTVEPGYLAEIGSKNSTTPSPETFEVTITWGDSITADKTYSEIMAAINADSKVAFTITAGGESVVSSGYYVFINVDDVSDKIIMVSVQSFRALEEKMDTLFFRINSENEIQMIEMEEITHP